MKLRNFIVFVCFALIVAAGLARAQVPTADRYGSPFNLDSQGVPYSSKYYQGRPADNVISLVRLPGLTEDQFVLRITNPYGVSGCANLSNFASAAEYKDIYLDISIDTMTVDMRDQPQYAHFQCDLHTQTPSADIIVNRKDLQDHGTQQLRLHNGTDTNYYNITLMDDRVMILPDEAGAAIARKFKPQNIPGKKTSLVYWFYPLGTVMLWVPGADKDMTQEVRDFATAHGLVPLESLYPDFESPLINSRYQYFVDTAGTFVNSNPDYINGAAIGTMSIQKKVFGLEKDEYKPYDIMVYAKIPGMYD